MTGEVLFSRRLRCTQKMYSKSSEPLRSSLRPTGEIKKQGRAMFTTRMKKSIAVITVLCASLPLMAAADSQTRQRIAVEGADSQIRQRITGEAVGSQITKQPPVDFDRCGNMLPDNNERYHWVEMDMDVNQRFYNDATNAGYPVGGPANQMYAGVPLSFKQQKETQYCNSYIDPAGFPHHISQHRTCSLHFSPLATLQYSGCYLKSSTRKRNRLQLDSQLRRMP